MSSQYKFYEILGCNKKSTQEELKRAYKKMALMYHPDKNNDNDMTCNEKFLELEEAWRTLGDPESRQKYDAECRQAELECENILIHDRIQLNDMIKEDGMLSYPCRCGSNYLMDDDGELHFDEIYIPCQECTFSIAVKK